MATPKETIRLIPPWWARMPGIASILLDGIVGADIRDSGEKHALEQMRALHPQLKTTAVQKKLAQRSPDGSPLWMTLEFWLDEIDSVLLEGIFSGRAGQTEAIERLCRTWGKLNRRELDNRMEELATQGLPRFLQDDFWQEELDAVLLDGITADGHRVRRAVDKVLRLNPDLRIEVIWARVRRLRKQRGKDGRRGFPFPWTSELDQQLLTRCAAAGLGIAVSEVQQTTGWPRSAILRRAHKLGVVVQELPERREWTAADKNFLVQSIRHVPVKAIARELDRTENSVWCKIWEEGLRARYEEDYSQRELCRTLHVRPPTVRRWVESEWLKIGRNGRIKDRSLVPFLREHADELDWEQVDRDWVRQVAGSEDENGDAGSRTNQSAPEPIGATEQDPVAASAARASSGRGIPANTLAPDRDEDHEPQSSLVRAASPQSSQN